MVDVTENYLNITEPYRYDNSVQKIEYAVQEPNNGINLNSGVPIEIVIEPNDNFLLPSRSYLYVEGKLVKEDGTIYTKDTVGLYPDIALTNNFFPYLFTDLRYKLNEEEIESFSNPGQCTTLKHLLTKSKSFEGTSMAWNIDTYDGSAKYGEYIYYPIKVFDNADFVAATPATPTKAELRTFADKFIPMFLTINNDPEVTQFTTDEFDAAVPAGALDTGKILALANLIIDKLNIINEFEIPYLVIGDIPGATRDNIVTVINKVSANFNKSTSLRDSFGIKQNRGFMRRKDLLFNPQSNVTPDTSAGRFSFVIPLSYLFNFCEQYDKVIYNCRHTLYLNRQTTSDYAIFKSRLTDNRGKVVLDTIRWYIPKIIGSEESQITLYKVIRNREEVPLAFMNKKISTYNDLNDKSFYSATENYSSGIEKPRYIVAAFQVYDKTSPAVDDLQNINHSIFNGTSERGRDISFLDLRYVNVLY